MRELKFRMWDDVLKVMYTPELDAEKLNFEDWLKLRKIERINDDAFKWEGSKYTYYYVNDIYKQYLKN